MATSPVSGKPGVLLQKPKRPPNLMQPATNGVKSSLPQPSPSPGAKRPSSASKHPPPTPTSHGSSNPLGAAGPRASNRRRDSQKPGEITGRPNRTARPGQIDGGQNGRLNAKRPPEPFVKTTQYILRKYRKSPPSLIVHLHPTHFRFDQQDGSCTYNSPMKLFLEHVKMQTVPHDMLDELSQANIKFYDNCLIVQLHDHRHATTTTSTTSVARQKDKNQPFSIHNYNEHITPSAFAPFPQKSTESRDGGSRDLRKTPASASDVANAGKENMLPPGHAGNTPNASSKNPRIFTTVLFSTPLSLQEEILRYANTPDTRGNRKQGQLSGRNHAGSVPPTPSTIMPPTPGLSGPSAKKQKMMFSCRDLANLESKIVSSTAPPLFLEPVNSMKEVQVLFEKLRDPLACKDPPAPKSRKRTVAELAADEAQAAEEQRFMLILDERLGPSAASISGGKAADDDEVGAASFEPRFERFKAIEEIKLALEEKAQRETLAKQLQAKQKQEQAEQQARQAQEQRTRETAQLSQSQQQDQDRMRQFQLRQQAQVLHQKQQMAQVAASQHAHPGSKAGIPNAHPNPATQRHESPIVRHMTPHSLSSPRVNNLGVGHAGYGVPMSASASGQGGSPPRPGSAIQHGHPTAGVPMAAQRSHQPSSLTGTPRMANGTPLLQHATPTMHTVTPTPRMSQASPAGNIVTSTPMMGQNSLAGPHMVGQHLTPQQQHAAMQRQALYAQSQGHNLPPSAGGPNLQQFATMHAQQQAVAAQQQQQQQQHQQQQLRNQELYRQSLQGFTNQQLNSIQSASQVPFGTIQAQQRLQQQQQQQQQQRQAQLQRQAQMQQQLQQGNPSRQTQAQYLGTMVKGLAERLYEQDYKETVNQYRGQVPQHLIEEMKAKAQKDAAQIVMAKRMEWQQSTQRQAMAAGQHSHQLQQQQQQQQQQAMAQMHGAAGNLSGT